MRSHPRSFVRYRLQLEQLECRLVPAGVTLTPISTTPDSPPAPPPPITPTPVPTVQPIVVPDFTGFYQLEAPTVMNLLGGATDPNPGATLDYTTIAITTPPTKGRLDVDPNTGMFIYTPNYLLLHQAQPYPNLVPEFFKFTVKDSVGAISNIATATFFGSVAPVSGGFVLPAPFYSQTHSLQAVSIDPLVGVIINDGSQVDPTSVAVDANSPGTPDDIGTDAPASPRFGSASVDPITGRITYTPNLGFTGFDHFTYTVKSTLGNMGRATIYVTVDATAAPRLQTDWLGGQMLVVDGTAGNDTILIAPGRHAGDVIVTVNGVSSGPFRPTGRIAVLGYGGDDRIVVDPRVQAPAWLVGGSGNDTLLAGGGSSVLLGGTGDDLLVSGLGRDLLIGGAGSDTLLGTGDDILVAGTTAFDSNSAALHAISTEWNSRHSLDQRVLNLTGQLNRKSSRRLNGDVYFDTSTAQDDGAPDAIVTGGSRGLTVSAPPGPAGDSVLGPFPPTDRPSSPFRVGHRCGSFHAQIECEHRGRADCIVGTRGRR
jgi:hypothetical protein